VQALAVPGFYAWSQWQPGRNIYFSSHFWKREGGNVVFDPLPLDDADAREIEALGGVATILLTNRDHERAAAAMRDRFGARILCSRREAGLFELRVDETFDRQVLPGISAIPLDGAKTPGEVAFLMAESGVAVVGDAIIGAPAGALSFMPDDKIGDPVALALSLRHLWLPWTRTLLLGDGASLFAGVDEALGALLEARGGPAVNRINLDELEYELRVGGGDKYRRFAAEMGYPIGARRLGYRAVRIPPGMRYCPLHSHDKCEEVFYVVEGTPSVRTPRGTLRLRPGDFMAFPVGHRGAHQLINESDADALAVLMGAEDDDEVCYYPDSRKVLIARRDLIVREDRLDYYDGE
jgi:uncharacterized cupin superfamily protein/glyoxylase-like metal-dependent hydrolase (beta-lactamase superfamily II)